MTSKKRLTHRFGSFHIKSSSSTFKANTTDDIPSATTVATTTAAKNINVSSPSSRHHTNNGNNYAHSTVVLTKKHVHIQVWLNEIDSCLLTNIPLDYTFAQVLYQVIEERALYEIMGDMSRYIFQIDKKLTNDNQKKRKKDFLNVSLVDTVGDASFVPYFNPTLRLMLKPSLDHSHFVKLFGKPLEFTCKNPLHRTFDARGFAIPRALQQCFDFLNKYALDEVGVFRVNGSAAVMQKIKQQWDNGDYSQPFEKSMDVNNVAGVLKLYLRELPEPLVEHVFYRTVKNLFVNTQISDERRLIGLRNTVQQLSSGHYAVLEHLISLCHKIQKNETVNKMNATNLATCLAPTILTPPASSIVNKNSIQARMQEAAAMSEVVAFLINNYSQIFTRNSLYDPELKGLEEYSYDFDRVREHKFDMEKCGTLAVEIIRCNNLIPADSNGLSDPYVILELGNQKYKTRTIKKVLNPVYMEQAEFAVENYENDEIQVSVYDWDQFKSDDFLGRTTISLSSAPLKRHRHELELQLNGIKHGSIEFILVPRNYGKEEKRDIKPKPHLPIIHQKPQEMSATQKKKSLSSQALLEDRRTQQAILPLSEDEILKKSLQGNYLSGELSTNILKRVSSTSSLPQLNSVLKTTVLGCPYHGYIDAYIDLDPARGSYQHFNFPYEEYQWLFANKSKHCPQDVLTSTKEQLDISELKPTLSGLLDILKDKLQWRVVFDAVKTCVLILLGFKELSNAHSLEKLLANDMQLPSISTLATAYSLEEVSRGHQIQFFEYIAYLLKDHDAAMKDVINSSALLNNLYNPEVQTRIGSNTMHDFYCEMKKKNVREEVLEVLSKLSALELSMTPGVNIFKFFSDLGTQLKFACDKLDSSVESLKEIFAHIPNHESIHTQSEIPIDIPEFSYLFLGNAKTISNETINEDMEQAKEKQMRHDEELSRLDTIYPLNKLSIIVESLDSNDLCTREQQEILKSSLKSITIWNRCVDIDSLSRIFCFLSISDVEATSVVSKAFHVASYKARICYKLSDLLVGCTSPYDDKTIPLVLPRGGLMQLQRFSSFLQSHILSRLDEFRVYSPTETKYLEFHNFALELRKKAHVRFMVDSIIISQKLPLLLKTVVDLSQHLRTVVPALQTSPLLKSFFKNMIIMTQIHSPSTNPYPFNLKTAHILLSNIRGRHESTLMEFVSDSMFREFGASVFDRLAELKTDLDSVIDIKHKYNRYKNQILQMVEQGEELVHSQQESIKLLQAQLDAGYGEELTSNLRKQLEVEQDVMSQFSKFLHVFVEAFNIAKRDVLGVASGYLDLIQIALCGVKEEDDSELKSLSDILTKLSDKRIGFRAFILDNMYSSDMITSLRAALHMDQHPTVEQRFNSLKKARCFADLLNMIKTPIDPAISSSKVFAQIIGAMQVDAVVQHGRRMSVSTIFLQLRNSEAEATEIDGVMLAIQNLLNFDNY